MGISSKTAVHISSMVGKGTACGKRHCKKAAPVAKAAVVLSELQQEVCASFGGCWSYTVQYIVRTEPCLKH